MGYNTRGRTSGYGWIQCRCYFGSIAKIYSEEEETNVSEDQDPVLAENDIISLSPASLESIWEKVASHSRRRMHSWGFNSS